MDYVGGKCQAALSSSAVSYPKRYPIASCGLKVGQGPLSAGVRGLAFASNIMNLKAEIF